MNWLQKINIISYICMLVGSQSTVYLLKVYIIYYVRCKVRDGSVQKRHLIDQRKLSSVLSCARPDIPGLCIQTCYNSLGSGLRRSRVCPSATLSRLRRTNGAIQNKTPTPRLRSLQQEHACRYTMESEMSIIYYIHDGPVAVEWRPHDDIALAHC